MNGGPAKLIHPLQLCDFLQKVLQMKQFISPMSEIIVCLTGELVGLNMM